MESTINPEQEWQWCLVGNIVKEHEYGENHEIRYGSRQFRPDAKVYINPVYGGMGHEHLLVIGMPRHSSQYIEITTARRNVCNFRVQKVYKPAVLKKMKESAWEWWGNSDTAYQTIVGCAAWMNAEAEQDQRT